MKTKLNKKVLLIVVAVIFILIIGFLGLSSLSSYYNNYSAKSHDSLEKNSAISRGIPASVNGGVYNEFSAEETDSASSSSSRSSNNLPADDGRKIIHKANFDIEITNYDKTFDQVVLITNNNGGFISNSKTTVSKEGKKSGYITIRVSADKFYNVISGIEGLETIKSKDITGEDVTERYIDIESRLNNAKKQEQRLLEILWKAENVDEILRVEQELNRVREQIELYTGQLRYLDNFISLATINVNLNEPISIVDKPTSLLDDIKQTLKNSITAFFNSVKVLIVWFGSILLYLIIIVIVYFIFRDKIKKLWNDK